MHCLLSTNVENSMTVFTLKDIIWASATVWDRVTTTDFKNRRQNLQPALTFEDNPDIGDYSLFLNFQVYLKYTTSFSDFLFMLSPLNTLCQCI